MRRVRLDAHLPAGEAPRARPQLLDGEREQSDADLLARRQDHVQLALVGARGHLLGQTNQPIRLAGHGRDDDHHVVARRARPGDAARHVRDPFHIPDRCAAIFLHDQRHPSPRRPTSSIQWVDHALSQQSPDGLTN